MSSEFEDKATRLFNRLNAVAHPARLPRPEGLPPASPQELLKLKEEIEASDFETRKKMRALTENLKRLEGALGEESESRAKMEEVLAQSVGKLERQMRGALAGVQKALAEKERRAEERLQAAVRAQRREVEGKLAENEALAEEAGRLEGRTAAMAAELADLRRNRLELEDRVARQFTDQLRDLKRIFEQDVRDREQREARSIAALKALYKAALDRIYSEERQREDSEKMLIAVVEQLVTHIIDA